ncbi:MAG: DUF6285 domain-containing protein [Pacificimonas sp.]
MSDKVRSDIKNADLVEAVAAFLDDVSGELSGRRAFHAKVARNALAIVLRELRDDPLATELAWYEDRTGESGEAARSAYCAQIRAGDVDPGDAALLAKMTEFVSARLAVDNPKFSTLQRLRELD